MPASPTAATADAERDSALIERHGITLVRADQYHVDGYRYTNLADALAQAARRAATAEDER